MNTFFGIFTKFYYANYQPLVLLSYALEYKLFGLNAGGYHVTNTVLHILNGVLVLLLIYTITKKTWMSLIIALLFCLHPMQVESVAWISERKGLMCAFFYFLSFMSYIRFSREDKKGFYYASIVLFLMSLLSKPMSITFPIILLLFDYYEGKLGRSKLIEKIPFLALSGIFSIVTLFAQRSGHAVGAVVTKASRNLLLAFYNIGFYIGKLIAPLRLSIHYGYPDDFSYTSIEAVISVFIIVGLAIYLVNFKKIKRGVNFGFLFFLISLVPILRIVPIGSTLAADRYMYIPMIGFFFAVATVFDSLISNKPALKKVFALVATVYVLFLSTLAYTYCGVWKNDYKLWSNVLKYNPGYYNASLGLGDYYMKRQEHKKAREYFVRVLDNKKGRESALYDVGLSYLFDNDIIQARKYFLKLIDEFPSDLHGKHVYAYMYLGETSAIMKRHDEAIGFYEKSLRLNPVTSRTNYYYAVSLESKGDIAEALKYYKLANKYDRDWELPKKALSRLQR